MRKVTAFLGDAKAEKHSSKNKNLSIGDKENIELIFLPLHALTEIALQQL